MERVDKAWGSETWLCNEEYCGKLLEIMSGAGSSFHRHLGKKEHLYCLDGKVAFTLDGRTVELTPGEEPMKVMPGVWHQFHGVIASRMIEISTHHNNADNERRTPSYRGTGCS